MDEKLFREVLLQNETYLYGIKLKHIKSERLIVSLMFLKQFLIKTRSKIEDRLPVTTEILNKL